MSVMQTISGYFKQLAGEVSGDQRLHDEGRRQASGVAAPTGPVADYSDPEQLKLYRLVPVAAASDTNWDLAPNQGVVVVRARSSGDARVVAAAAELDYLEIDALPADGNSTASSSAFRNERLYTVVDETNPSYPLEGPREVVAGTVRVDNIRPTEL